MFSIKPNNQEVNDKVYRNILNKAVIATLTVAALFVTTSAMASVYKVTGPDGSVTFTDSPQNYQGESGVSIEPMSVSSISTVPSSDPDSSSSSNRNNNNLINTNQNTTNTSRQSTRNTDNINYQLKIVSPEQEQVYRRPAQQIDIVVNVRPTLNNGDVIKISIDNEQVGTGTHVSLPTLEMTPGKHTLTVDVINNAGDTLERESTEFYVIQNTVAFQRNRRFAERLNAYNDLPWYTKLYLQLRQNELHQNDTPVGIDNIEAPVSSAFTNGGSGSSF